MAVDPNVFSLVLAGAMNPRIHHPSWYRAMGLIDEAEEKLAISDNSMFVVPNLSQLGFGDFRIICQEGRWEMRVSKLENIDRLINITSIIFDELLKHTPVTAFGINFIANRATDAASVSEVLAGFLSATPLGLDDAGATGADIGLKRVAVGRTATVTIRQGSVNSHVNISHSYEYLTKIEKIMKFFEIREILNDRFPSDLRESLSQVDAVVLAINACRNSKEE